jgi:uncharacterized repeat protein (TIGR04138 family)
VFQLIDEGMFGKQDSDSPEDFSEIFDLDDELVRPFLPKQARPAFAAKVMAS